MYFFELIYYENNLLLIIYNNDDNVIMCDLSALFIYLFFLMYACP